MKVFLTGGGDSDAFVKFDKTFIQELGKDQSLLLIPLANDPDEFDDTFERIEETFGAVGFKGSIDMIKKGEDLDSLDLADYGAVYIDGGNTFLLIEQIMSGDFPKRLKAFAEEGGIIASDSAGALILGAHIQTAFIGEDADENEAKLQAFHGLDLFENWALHCHYDYAEDESLQDLVYDRGASLLALPEPTGIYINDDQVEVFGREPLSLFTMSGKKEQNVGQKFSLSEMLNS